jgi:uncharacterized protein (TIGR00725 family)
MEKSTKNKDPLKREALGPDNKIRRISFFGFADSPPTDPLYQEAYELSFYLARKGFDCVNGAGPGTMKAVSEGAKAAGGHVVGVTFYPKDITNFEGRDKTNPIDEEVVTANYLERTLKLIEIGDAFVVFRGSTGTISEFAMAWELAFLYFGRHKPLILYGSFWEQILKSIHDNMRLRPGAFDVLRVVNNPEEAYEAIQLFEGKLTRDDRIATEGEDAFQL